MRQEEHRVRWIDGMRGVAAMSVMWFHLYTQNGDKLVLNAAPGVLNYLSIQGRYGIELFFVISGFVLCLTLISRADVNSLASVGRYFLRRSVRLDITYLVVLAAFLLFAPPISEIARKHGDLGLDSRRLFFSIFYFLPRDAPLYVPVAWTLAIEVQFYIFFALVVVAVNKAVAAGMTRAQAVSCALWGTIALSAPPVLHLADVQIGYWLWPKLYSFAVGIGAAAIFLRIPNGWSMFATAMAVTLAGFYLQGRLPVGGPALATFLSGIVVAAGVVSAPARRLMEIRPLLYLGALSYCIYLLHQLTGSMVIEALQATWSEPGLLQVGIVVVGCCATLIASHVLHQLVELPSIRWSRKVRLSPHATGAVTMD